MKRFTLIVALVLMVAMPMMAERVTPETARKVATTFLNNNGAKTNQLIDLSKAAGFPNLYIFSTEESFVILSADDCVKPVLGYSLTGKFVAEDMPENVCGWLQGYSDEIQFAIDHKTEASSDVKKRWKELIDRKTNVAKAIAIVNPLIQTTWNQSPYYNDMCPYDSQAGARTVTGCVATAMAQIMKFWNYPSHGIGYHSYTHITYGQQSADFGNATYTWENMPNSINSANSEIAQLMYHCGVSVDMDYGLSSQYGGNGSSAISYDIPSALINYFNYDDSTRFVQRSDYQDYEEWKNLLKIELNKGRPMEYSGSGSGGHSFVCDGYDSEDNFHFNWGWGGSFNNAFYSIDDLTPGSYNYNYTQSAVIGIKPATIGQAVAPTLQAELVQETGVRNAQLTWNRIDNAKKYQIYRNTNLIHTTSSGDEISFTDVHIPYGTNTYYIRSVDTNDNLSWPSNYKSLTITLSAPTNLLVQQTENGVMLSWLAGENAVSYNIYCNNVLISSNVFTTTYIDNRNIAGLLSFYVRSVDALNDESGPSEAVQITIPYSTPTINNLSVSLLGGNASLSWTAPNWCYPATSSTQLTYGTQEPNGLTMIWDNNSTMFWGHRYLTEAISTFDGKKLYKASFYANNLGTYELCVFQGSTVISDNNIIPTELIASQIITVSELGWNTIDLSTPIIINGGQDLWVFIHNPEPIENLRAHICTANGSYGFYYSNNLTSHTNNQYSGYAFLIKALVTDGTYTYNLYQDGVSIANNLTQTSYSDVALNNNAANLFTVKTNYYAGETDASNKIGFAKGSASLNGWEMAANDKMTLTEGSTLTVSGDITNSNPDNLILENGAQLIHNSTGVKATVKKNIAPYTGNYGGWNFIASPVTETLTPSEENGFLNGTVGQGNNTYDLYYYYEPNHLWKNYETAPFNIVHKQGYLYANGETEGTTLQFAGTLTPSNNSVTINNLSHSSAVLNGFNLVGNPFVCNATVDKDFYVIDNTTNEVVLAPQNAVIAPCEGVFVQASDINTSVTFSKANAAKGSNTKESFDIIVTQGKANVDRARVRLGEGIGMEKFSLDDEHSQTSLWQNGQDYAVAYTHGATELPLNFKAKKDGTYTLAIEAKSLNLDYLHLIDNRTGNDIDLLATPSYTFEAKTTDYASRFKLVFNDNGPSTGSGTEDSETFAFNSNGNWIISNEGNATLQIIDALGHHLSSQEIHSAFSIPNSAFPTPGVYVLRLITTNGVRTQKIVIE